jgi:hypothetical protein
MMATDDAYFGYGRDSQEIAEVARIRGSLESKRPDFFRRAGIFVDIVDVRTGELVFRSLVKGDVIQGPILSPAIYEKRIAGQHVRHPTACNMHAPHGQTTAHPGAVEYACPGGY